ncbi:MAG: DNA gyrase inhibitor YacG [Immundisolibacteraceae bacterium]|nr:DNA gyrase inhibitor YacG [Immundisolibacteraceae bacterium]
MSQVKCPSCDKLTEWSDANPSRPFCSARCKMSDLNGWLSDEYKLNDRGDIEDQPKKNFQLLDPLEDELNH